jgi:DNA ligase-1
LYCFDFYHKEFTFEQRYNWLVEDFEDNDCPFAVLLDHIKIKNETDLDLFEKEAIEHGYEGIMIRDADGLYKCGRSGTKNPELQKVKRFVDSEFKIVGYEPKYHNANEAKINELGRTSRSTSKENLIALPELGALILEVPDGSGRTFSCGSGFTAMMRSQMWEAKDSLVGQYSTVKYFEVGMQEGIPRFPIFKGLRWKGDM